MPDISIGNSFDSEQPKKAVSSKGEYSKAEKEYIEFRIKLQKSDFANSSSAMKSELKLLSKMKEAAKKEGLEEKIAEIEEREKELTSQKRPIAAEFAPYYKPISFSGKEKSNNKQDEAVKNISSVFTDASENHVEYLIKKLTSDNTVSLSDSVAEAMLRIGEMGCHPNTALYFFEEFATEPKDSKAPKIIDLSMVDKFEKLKSKIKDDNDIIKVLSLFNKNYEDKALLDLAINEFADLKISPERIIDIISVLSVKNDNDNLYISPDSVQHVATLKNTLLKTENIEKKEDKNPIALLNTMEIETEEDIIVFKDGEVSAIYPKNENSERNYKEYISELQDDIVYNFTEKYTNEQGKIPFDAIRVATLLRRSGVTMKSLMPLMDFCYQKGEINGQNLKAVYRIKKAGALSSDILKILSAIPKDKEGNYNSDDLENAKTLTQACIDGNNVALLLPLVRDSKDAMDITLYLSEFIQKKSNIVDLIKLTKNKDGSSSEQSIEILNNLTKNYLDTEDNKPMDSIDFLLNAQSILNAAKGSKTNSVGDDAAGICAIMCSKKEPPENILRGLHICKNQDGDLDSSLADILWNMKLEDASIEEIEILLDKCKDDTGVVNRELTEKILNLYEKGNKTKEIMEIVLNTG